MLQLPLPQQAPDSVTVPLPDAVERWRDLYLHDLGPKLVVFAVLAFLLFLLGRLIRRQLGAQIEDVNRRHALRKWIGRVQAVLLVLVAVALFADSLTGLGTLLAVLLAGVAVALQDVLKSVVGWLYISGRSGVEVGSRVEVAGVVGDVIDVGVLKTTLLEVGNLVYGRQSTGRLVTIPNYRFVAENVFASAQHNPFVWQEVRITVPFECPWQRAEAILKEIGDDIYAELAPELERGFRGLERRYAFKYGKLTPIVYVTLGDSGVELTLRYLIHVRRRRGSANEVSRRILDAFARDPDLRLAYPAYRIYPEGMGER